MLIGFFCLAIMGIVAYAFWREGALTSLAMLMNTLIAGVVAFNFWEPLADALEGSFAGTFLANTEDALSLMVVFCPTLMLLRWAANSVANSYVDYPPFLNRGASVVLGVLTGYLASGFLVCVLQTLPWDRNFLGFEAYEPGRSTGARKYLPPDLVWLSLMHKLSGMTLTTGEEDPVAKAPKRFDRNGNFVLRYLRYRRLDEKGNAPSPRFDLEP